MKFCPDCKNMLYTLESGEEGGHGGNSLKLSCRSCP